MPTVRQNTDFGERLMPPWPLDDAIEWIKGNLEPADVFEEKQLIDWAEAGGYELTE